MPPAVLADSDDDGENVSLEPEPLEHSNAAPGSNAQQVKESTNAQSTGSTERLRNQIRSAERGLLAITAQKAVPDVRSSDSPAMKASKRRHTAAFDAEASPDKEKRVKRTKTTTYSKKRSSGRVNDDDDRFEEFRNDETAPATSQSIAFTEHSGVRSSGGLPAGSMRDQFVNHEPNVMFRDTGSTVVDNESSQLRVLEQTRLSKNGLTASAVKGVESDDTKSSPFPWTASTQTPSDKRAPISDEKTLPADELLETHTTPEAQQNHLPSQSEPKDAHKASQHQQQEAVISQEEIAVTVNDEDLASKRYVSPRVVIEAPAAPTSASMQKSTKTRKRKAPDEELSSEAQLVGLPPEKYVPRPSRRRSEQLVEPVDYSVAPERAVRKKRTKTTASVVSEVPAEDLPRSQPEVFCGPAVGQLHTEQAATMNDVTEGAQAPNSSLIRAIIGKLGDETDATTDSHKADEPLQQPKHNDDEIFVKPKSSLRSQPPEQQDDDETFVKPTVKPKSKAKTKRSHTTIYEDHVAFPGSQKSPTLSQQQASRKSVLQAVENELSKGTQRKRRKVVDDEDEDEGELPTKIDEDLAVAELQAEEAVEEAPKKRGRGRPPKSAASATAKVSESLLEDVGDARPDVVLEPEPQVLPKTKGRGRPAKANIATHVETVVEPSATPVEDETSGAADTPVRSSAKPLQAPTPSPEKPRIQPQAATPLKASPTSHSPIKSSSAVPLRVGLNKRQRIPSLLKIIKPPKR